MTDWTFWIAVIQLIVTFAGVIFAQTPLRVFPAKELPVSSTKRIRRVTVPHRFPIRGPGGAILLTREEAKKVIDQERGGRYVNLFGAVFSLGMLFTLYEIANNPGDLFTCLGICTVNLNLSGIVFLVFIPLTIELVGAGVIADARRRKRAPGWAEIQGEMAALVGERPTRRSRVGLTEQEKKWLDELEKEEERSAEGED
jgi:hypothetical protein